MAEPRFQALLIGAFALLALIMTTSGLYSVVSCLVTQRTREIAIHIALGASRANLAMAIMRPTILWVLAGLTVGAGLGLAGSRLVQKLSWSADPGDPAMYALLLYLGVTLLACWLPVRRASRLDPNTALHCE